MKNFLIIVAGIILMLGLCVINLTIILTQSVSEGFWWPSLMAFVILFLLICDLVVIYFGLYFSGYFSPNNLEKNIDVVSTISIFIISIMLGIFFGDRGMESIYAIFINIFLFISMASLSKKRLRIKLHKKLKK